MSTAVTRSGDIGPLASLAGAPWAITPPVHAELLAIYGRRIRGEHADLAAIEARIGKPLQNPPQQGYETLSGGVAVVDISGVIAPKMNMLIAVSGGTSAQLAARDISAAAADPAVRSILLTIDSPGGSVLGIPELAQAVREAAASKTVVAFSDGALCSAAYWVASAANAIYVSGPTVQVGSIGVVATHYENSRAQAAAGTKTTEVVAGKYKRIASAHEPLSKEGHATLQAQVDYIYGLFVDAVAENRGVSSATVLDRMADGRVFIGQQAVTAGLVDGITSLDALIADLAANPSRYAKRRTPPATAAPARATAAIAAPSLTVHSKGAPVYSTTPTATAPPPSAEAVAAAAAAERSAACAAAVSRVVSVFAGAMQVKPNVDALERFRLGLPASAQAAVKAASAEAPRPTVSADRRAAQNAAAARAVSLFKQANPE